MGSNERFAYSLNGDRFVGSFTSRQEALEAGIAHAREIEDPPLAVYVGRLIPALPAARGHAASVIEQMRERAEAENRQAVEEYLARVTPQQAAELDEDLARAIDHWLRHHGPSALFDVEAISEHPVPFPPEVPAPPTDEVHDIGETNFPGE